MFQNFNDKYFANMSNIKTLYGTITEFHYKYYQPIENFENYWYLSENVSDKYNIAKNVELHFSQCN